MLYLSIVDMAICIHVVTNVYKCHFPIAWPLKIFKPAAPEAITTSGVIWSDIDSILLVKQVIHLLYGNCSRYR